MNDMRKGKKYIGYGISNKSGLGTLRCGTFTRGCAAYSFHKSKKCAMKDLMEVYNPIGLKVVRVEITIKDNQK